MKLALGSVLSGEVVERYKCKSTLFKKWRIVFKNGEYMYIPLHWIDSHRAKPCTHIEDSHPSLIQKSRKLISSYNSTGFSAIY